MKQTIAFIYGFAEGPWHGRKFAKNLVSAGYKIINEPAKADIVIAHSAGCYYVPLLHGHQKLILINPTYWPGKSRRTRGLDRLKYDVLHLLPSRQGPYLLYKTTWNLFFIVTHFPHNRDIVHRSGHFRLQESLSHHRTTIIRNEADPWLTPEIDHLKETHKGLRVYHVPGDHDDCWLHPERYIRLLQSL